MYVEIFDRKVLMMDFFLSANYVLLHLNILTGTFTFEKQCYILMRVSNTFGCDEHGKIWRDKKTPEMK